MPLHGIAPTAGEESIAIYLGTDERAEHDIPSPLRIDVEEEDGAERALCIRSESGESTRMSFRAAVLPEAVDGILPE